MTGQLRYEASGLAGSARVDLASGEGTGLPTYLCIPAKFKFPQKICMEASPPTYPGLAAPWDERSWSISAMGFFESEEWLI